MLKNIALASAAFTLVAAPVAAQQAESQAPQNAAPASKESSLGGPNLFFYLGIAIVAASILLLSEDDDPVSA